VVVIFNKTKKVAGTGQTNLSNKCRRRKFNTLWLSNK